MSAAIGFAVYLSELERLIAEPREFDVDALVVYDEGCDPAAVAARAQELVAEGKTVRIQPRGEADITCRELVEVTG